mmetsp:Transcript_34345/g.87956  ORF Transcript_34345/g.87956 Transcript_34345/m.87956 type:complete len:352 (-) Transcript_34345:4-1059(-)
MGLGVLLPELLRRLHRQGEPICLLRQHHVEPREALPRHDRVGGRLVLHPRELHGLLGPVPDVRGVGACHLPHEVAPAHARLPLHSRQARPHVAEQLCYVTGHVPLVGGSSSADAFGEHLRLVLDLAAELGHVGPPLRGHLRLGGAQARLGPRDRILQRLDKLPSGALGGRVLGPHHLEPLRLLLLCAVHHLVGLVDPRLHPLRLAPEVLLQRLDRHVLLLFVGRQLGVGLGRRVCHRLAETGVESLDGAPDKGAEPLHVRELLLAELRPRRPEILPGGRQPRRELLFPLGHVAYRRPLRRLNPRSAGGQSPLHRLVQLGLRRAEDLLRRHGVLADLDDARGELRGAALRGK